MKLIYESSPIIPDIVYHGGYCRIEPEDFNTNIQPCFFTPYEEYAKCYADDPRHKNHVVTAYRLDIKRPFHLGDRECLRIYTDEFIPWALGKRYADDWKNQPKLMNPKLGDGISCIVADYLYPFLRRAKRKGIYDYDGMIVDEGLSYYSDSYVPFDKSQISLA